MIAVIPPLGPPGHVHATLEEEQILLLQRVEGCVEHFAPWHHNHIVPPANQTAAKNLPGSSFEAVTLDSRTDLPRRGDAQPSPAGFSRHHEEHHVLATHAAADLVHALEFGTFEEARTLAERLTQRTTLRLPPSSAFAPSRGDA